MKSLTLATISLAAISLAIAAPHKAGTASIGEVTPDWNLTDSNGKAHDVTQYRGKYVVLEWTNPQCPFVQKHYLSGNMQATQKEAKSMGAVWLTVNSSAPGKQGSLTPEETNAYRAKLKVMSNATLLDGEGTVGRIYGAKATPQIAILDPKGVLIYDGAIDDKPTADQADIPGAKNYALAALKEAMAGKPVTVATSQPYGCGIKYAH
jgi:hypothetical protein